MASVSKRTYWVDPRTGKECRAQTPGAECRTSRFWRIRYAMPDGTMISRRGYTDKRASQQLAAKLEGMAARGEQNLINVYAQHNRRPLKEHLADYLADLAMHGRDDEYAYILRKRIERLAEECNWTRLRDVTVEGFDQWRRQQAAEAKVSGKTLNQFRDALRGFMNWLAKPERARIPANPIAGLTALPHTPTFQRRALQAEQLEALYAAAPLARYRVYVFAVTTGLRRQEIEDLEWGDVALDATIPFLHLREVATKARRADTFALKPEVAAMLKEMRPADWHETMKVFPEGVPPVAVLQEDLRRAGVELPAEGSLDRIDFHALRTTLGSFIGLAGISERVGMELLRVTDPKLLRKTYCDPRVLQTAQAAASLPIPTAPRSVQGQQAKATGTDHAQPVQNRTMNSRRDTPLLSATVRRDVLGGADANAMNAGDNPHVSAMAAKDCDVGEMHQLGLEPSGSGAGSLGNLKFPGVMGQESDKDSENGAPAAAGQGESDFQELAKIWPGLPAATRAALLALARAAGGGGA